MNFKKIAVVVLIIAAAFIANYVISYKRRKDADQEAFDAIIAELQPIGSNNFNWVLEAAQKLYATGTDGEHSFTANDLVNGERTKTAALVIVWGTSIQPFISSYPGITAATNERIWAIWTSFRAKQIAGEI